MPRLVVNKNGGGIQVIVPKAMADVIVSAGYTHYIIDAGSDPGKLQIVLSKQNPKDGMGWLSEGAENEHPWSTDGSRDQSVQV